MDIVKISWSGGKDSTASCLIHLMRGDVCKIVYYIPMLTKSIPLIMPEHYNFILNSAVRFEEMGAQVYEAKGISYYDHVHTIISKGKNSGLARGYGLGFGFCQFRDYSKIKALVTCNVGDFEYEDIGIAFDEIERQSQLNEYKRSVLVERKVTEKDAFKLCLDYDFLSPLYFSFRSRDGCAICPNASKLELYEYCQAYPDAYNILLEIDSFCHSKDSRHFRPFRDCFSFEERLSNIQLPLI